MNINISVKSNSSSSIINTKSRYSSDNYSSDDYTSDDYSSDEDDEVEQEVYICSKCNKEYKTLKGCETHEKKCYISQTKGYRLGSSNEKISSIPKESKLLKPIQNNISQSIKKKKKKIPSTLKRLVWNKYIGEDIGKSKCLCCKLTDITQLSFHCGHVISEFNSGSIDIENLRPICQNCNSSMGSQNMDEFINMFKLHTV
jgi:hypothetical protein